LIERQRLHAGYLQCRSAARVRNAPHGAAEELSDEQVKEIIATNLVAPIQLIRACCRMFVARAVGASSRSRRTVVGRNEWVAARLRHQGTHTGAFMGIPAAGRSAEVGATGFYRIVEYGWWRIA
jgi:predicted ester cyclase